jgi:hypothetical protein
MKGRNTCYHHGGKSLLGSAVNTYRHGRHSKYLPVRLAAKYAEAQHDRELLSLRDELALVDARLADLLARVDTGESGSLWLKLMRAWRAFKSSQDAGDIARMHSTLAAVEAHVEAGAHDHGLWREIGEQIEQRRKLAESESKRLVALQQVITTQQALLMAGAIVDIITRHVPDKKILSEVIVELQVLMTREQIITSHDDPVALIPHDRHSGENTP